MNRQQYTPMQKLTPETIASLKSASAAITGAVQHAAKITAEIKICQDKIEAMSAAVHKAQTLTPADDEAGISALINNGHKLTFLQTRLDHFSPTLDPANAAIHEAVRDARVLIRTSLTPELDALQTRISEALAPFFLKDSPQPKMIAAQADAVADFDIFIRGERDRAKYVGDETVGLEALAILEEMIAGRCPWSFTHNTDDATAKK